LIGLEPGQVPIIQTARQIGFGCSDLARIEVAGDALPASGCPDFERPELGPIKFSLPHVCRSLTRQFLLLLGFRRA
jgi:hypothetical protein